MNLTKTYKIALTGIFIAISVIVNYFTKIPINIGGVQLIQINFSSPFLEFISIVVSPLFGGISFAIADIINFILKPSGAFTWQITFIVFCKGYLIGIIWNLIKDKTQNFTSSLIGLSGFLIGCFAIFGIINFNSLATSKNLIKIEFAIAIGIVVGLIFFTIFILSKFTSIFKNKHKNNFIKIFISIFFASVFQTIFDTFILIYYFFQKSSFLFFLLPRFGVMIVVSIYSSIFVAFLLYVYRTYKRNEIQDGVSN